MAFITGKKAKESHERRAAQRRRVSVGCWIISPDGSLAMDCQVQDISHEGAKILLKEAVPLPPTVFYMDRKDRIAYEAQLRWQNKTEAGLQFTKAYRFTEIGSSAVKKALEALDGATIVRER